MKYKIITETEITRVEITETEVSLLEYIGHKLREAREAKGLNLSQLSTALHIEKMGLSDSYLGKLEKGDTNSMKITDLVKLCEFFNVKLGYFLPIESIE